MLINSANLMGGSSEPDGDRGFGRVHLQAGLPLNGEGDVGLYVADSARDTSILENSKEDYKFVVVDGDTGEFRATLSWIDPSSTVSQLVASQLTHDLDLTVTSPSGTGRYTYTRSQQLCRFVVILTSVLRVFCQKLFFFL